MTCGYNEVAGVIKNVAIRNLSHFFANKVSSILV